MSQITVISGIEQRRRWTEQQKQDLVAAVSAPGANVAEIARRADLRPNQIYKWRRQMDEAAQGFAEVKVQPDRAPVVGSMILREQLVAALAVAAEVARIKAINADLKAINADLEARNALLGSLAPASWRSCCSRSLACISRSTASVTAMPVKAWI